MIESLSFALKAILSAPEDVNTNSLKQYCTDNGMDAVDVDDCVAESRTDIGAVAVAFKRQQNRQEPKKAAKKKAKKKA